MITYCILILLPLFQLGAQSAVDSLKLVQVLSDLTSSQRQQCTEELEKLKSSDEEQDRYATQKYDRQLAELQKLSLQLKKVQIFTKNSNYREALQILQRLESQITSYLTSDRALEAIIELSGELQALQQNAHQIWYAEIDAVVEEARSVCLQAETSSELDPLLIKVAALEMKRPNASSNIVVTRGTDKLRGTVSSLQSWMRYLDHRSAGNAKAANEMLKQLGRNTSNYPLLNQEQLSDKWLEVIELQDSNQVAIAILVGIKGPDDLVRGIQEFEVAADNPQITKNEYFRADIIPKLITLKTGFDALEQGDLETAQSMSKPFTSYRPNLKPYMDALKNQLIKGIFIKKLEQFSGQPFDPKQSDEAQIEAVLAKLWEDEKLLELKEALLLEPKKANSNSSPRRHIQTALNYYLTAQKFEEANDVISAYQNYRYTLKRTGTEHPLNQLAVDAIKRMRVSHTDQLQQFDESALIEGMEALTEELMRYNRSPSRMGRY